MHQEMVLNNRLLRQYRLMLDQFLAVTSCAQEVLTIQHLLQTLPFYSAHFVLKAHYSQLNVQCFSMDTVDLITCFLIGHKNIEEAFVYAHVS